MDPAQRQAAQTQQVVASYEHRLQTLCEKLAQSNQERDQVSSEFAKQNAYSQQLLQQNKQLTEELTKAQVESAKTKSDLAKAQSDCTMMQGFIKLKQAMNDMKDQELGTCKDTINQLKASVRTLQGGPSVQQQLNAQADSESIESLRAKVHSLAFLNREANSTQAKMREDIQRLELELASRESEIEKLKQEALELNAAFLSKGSQIQCFEEEIRSLQSQISTQQRDNEQSQVAYNAQLSALYQKFDREQKQNLSEAIHAFELKEQLLKQEVLEHQARIVILESQNQKLKQDYSQCQEQRQINIPSNKEQDPIPAHLIPQLSPMLASVAQTLQRMQSQQEQNTVQLRKEHELMNEVRALREANIALEQRAKVALEAEGYLNELNHLKEQLEISTSVNQTMLHRYQSLRDDLTAIRTVNKTLELANSGLQQQFKEFAESIDQQSYRYNEGDIQALISQISNRTYATVSKYMENMSNSHSIDLQKLRAQWQEMQADREKERKLMTRLTQEIKKAVASASNSQKLESVLKYLAEQMDLLKDYSHKQGAFFDSIALKLKSIGDPLDQAASRQEVDSLNSQIQRLESQVHILTTQAELLKQDLAKFRDQAQKLRGENEAQFNQLHGTRKDLIEQMKLVECQQSELQALRIENRMAKINLEERVRDLSDLRANHSRLLQWQEQMSQVRVEYKLQSADAFLNKNIQTINIENQELKIRVQDLSQKLEEYQGTLAIFKEDYQLMKNSYDSFIVRGLTTQIAVPRQVKQQSSNQETQTCSSNLEYELAELFVNIEQPLIALNDELVSRVEELVQLFYAYSRSETKIDEKEAEFKESLASKEVELEQFKEAVAKQSSLANQFRDRIQHLQMQMSTIQSQKAQQQQAGAQGGPQGRSVVQQDLKLIQSVQHNQQLDKKIADLTREKGAQDATLTQFRERVKELEGTIMKLRNDSSTQLRLSHNKQVELRAEIDRLTKLQVGEKLQQPAVSVTVGKLMQSLHRAQKVLISQQTVIDGEQKQEDVQMT